jgi:anti-anti-sigma regulatory factor
MDCSGLHACITAWDRARQDGRQVLFVGATRAVRRVFELTGTEYILDQTDQMSTSTKTSFAATEAPGIRVAGELDMSVAEQLADLVGTADLDAPLLIDMTNVTFVDMAGWRAIWDTLRQGDANDPTLSFSPPQRSCAWYGTCPWRETSRYGSWNRPNLPMLSCSETGQTHPFGGDR